MGQSKGKAKQRAIAKENLANPKWQKVLQIIKQIESKQTGKRPRMLEKLKEEICPVRVMMKHSEK